MILFCAKFPLLPAEVVATAMSAPVSVGRVSGAAGTADLEE